MRETALRVFYIRGFCSVTADRLFLLKLNTVFYNFLYGFNTNCVKMKMHYKAIFLLCRRKAYDKKIMSFLLVGALTLSLSSNVSAASFSDVDTGDVSTDNEVSLTDLWLEGRDSFKLISASNDNKNLKVIFMKLMIQTSNLLANKKLFLKKLEMRWL